jgi:hypothetical protein
MRMKDIVRRIQCRVVGHEWKLTEFRVTHGQLVCRRCDHAEWQRN